MRTLDPILNPLLCSCVAWFGGKSPSMPKAPKQEPIQAPAPPPAADVSVPQIVIPEPVAPAPIPPTPPTATESNLEAQNKASQVAADAKRRKGMAASLISGETGGYRSSATGGGSLLG